MVTTLLWMWSGCSTDDYQLTPGDGVELIQAYSSGGDREPDPDPETDCKCYMRVNSVENAQYQKLWGIIDWPSDPNLNDPFTIEGTLNYYRTLDNQYLELPSDFRELNPPSNGWHTMVINYDGTNDDLVVYTEVRCYLQHDNGSETLATTTYHQFNIAEGDKIGDTYWFAPRQFSCKVLSDNGGTPGN